LFLNIRQMKFWQGLQRFVEKEKFLVFLGKKKLKLKENNRKKKNFFRIELVTNSQWIFFTLKKQKKRSSRKNKACIFKAGALESVSTKKYVEELKLLEILFNMNTRQNKW
jgi:hypothetical protein